MKKYDHKKIEKKWQEQWGKDKIYKTADNQDKKKYYILDMFPYPSGAGLHVGHPKGYIATDIFARMKKMRGFNVLHPMGWDAFGLPAENFALKNKIHPRVCVGKNVAVFKRQLGKLGLSYDWDKEINTTNPEFYKWTQWVFIQMFKKGLAYESYEPINWCPSCKTGLANEDLEDGKCERCGSEIEKKPMRQWVLKITDYAERMLQDLDKLPEWENSIKEMQRNWIGRSDGSIIKFCVVSENDNKLEIDGIFDNQIDPQTNTDLTQKNAENFQCSFASSSHKSAVNAESIEVFTTRPDTLFGATYMVLAPEHPLITELLKENYELKNLPTGRQVKNYEKVREYIEKTKKKNEIDRTDFTKEKTGIEIKGIKAINPANKKEIPIFIADYVLVGYGTGAIMAVPAHDMRDREFAKFHKLDFKCVITPDAHVLKDKENLDPNSSYEEYIEKHNALIGDGSLMNSGRFNGMNFEEAKKAITEFVGGKIATTYKIQDWVFSRQRYWGEPIPIIHCKKCGAVPVLERDLPVKLPEVENYEPTGTGESPLANISEWVNTICPKCGGSAKRETNTMPQWAGSSWYYLRYIDPHNSKNLISKEKDRYWSPVDFYVGGAEHATRHLIYARFWHKFLYDIGVLNYDEPFTRLRHVGLILAEDGRKMSKRWENTINPDDIVEKFGADSMRIYEMFMGPFSQSCAWDTNGLMGARRFLEKVWRMRDNLFETEADKNLLRVLHKTIKKVGEDTENFKLNTAISAMMELVNEMEKFDKVSKDAYEKFLKILASFAPHITEEVWQELGHKTSIHLEKWPEYDAGLAKDETHIVAVQINGKVRAEIEIVDGLAEDEVKEKMLVNEQVQKWLGGKEIKKTIYIKNKIFSIVI